jgi:ATPase family associated with various cellular activities (AAA)
MDKDLRAGFDLDEVLRAYVPIFCVRSIEVGRLTEELSGLAKELGMEVNVYDPGGGLKRPDKQWATMDPVEVLDEILRSHIHNQGGGRPVLWILRLYHLFLQDPDPLVVSKLRLIHDYPQCSATVALQVEPHFCLPAELDDLLVLDFPLPDRLCLGGIIEADVLDYDPTTQDELVGALGGLTRREAENILSLSLLRKAKFDPGLIRSLKDQVIRNKADQVLEFLWPDVCLEDVGGMEGLIDWLRIRQLPFLDPQKLLDHRIRPPRGMLLLGVPGCGKTLVSKAIAGSWGLPLLKIQACRLYTSEVGGSEQRLAKALETARAMAPCVLLVDEIEKGFAPVSSFSDGGIALRIQAALLDFLQESAERVFTVATSNAIGELPPELLRRGRWDEIFFVDLPAEKERHRIFEVLFRRHKIPANVDPDCVRATEGYSGAEIEQAILDTFYTECVHGNRPISPLALMRQIRNLVPLSELMREDIKALRDWAVSRTRTANGREPCTGRNASPRPQHMQ